jgi:RHS repeat-associated protein
MGGRTIGQRVAAGVSWLFADPQGTALLTTDAATGARTQRRQTPYGTPRGTVPTWVNNKGYIGGTQDPSGLTHEGARELDPTTGRFISADSVLETNDPNQLGGYTYAGDDPTNSSDPTGLFGFSWHGLLKAAKAVNNGTTWAGIGMMVLGAAMDGAAGALAATGVGAPIAAALAVEGTQVAIAGALTATAGVLAGSAQNIMNSTASGSSSGGHDSGDEADPKATEREQQVKELLKEHAEDKKTDQTQLERINAETAVDGPGESRTVKGAGGQGADIEFRDGDGNVIFRREVKAVGGKFSNFQDAISKGAEQVDGDGEVFIQEDISSDQFDHYLNEFRRTRANADPAKLAKYTNVTVRVVEFIGPRGRFGTRNRANHPSGT